MVGAGGLRGENQRYRLGWTPRHGYEEGVQPKRYPWFSPLSPPAPTTCQKPQCGGCKGLALQPSHSCCAGCTKEVAGVLGMWKQVSSMAPSPASAMQKPWRGVWGEEAPWKVSWSGRLAPSRRRRADIPCIYICFSTLQIFWECLPGKGAPARRVIRKPDPRIEPLSQYPRLRS